jgi:hypothetical protein
MRGQMLEHEMRMNRSDACCIIIPQARLKTGTMKSKQDGLAQIDYAN